GSPQRIICLHTLLSSTSAFFKPTICMSSLTTSINLLLGLPLFLLPGDSILSILLPIYPMSLLCTCAVPLINPFLILSILVSHNENLNIFSSATSSSTSCLLLNATVSNPYNIAGLTTVL
ncbi:hypothetical protein HF521_004875, partial [Silurus meridionalis]